MMNVVKLLIGSGFCFGLVFSIFKLQQSHKFRDIVTTEFSDIMTEPAEVIEVVFTPSTRHTTDSVDNHLNPQVVDIPEKYSVVFKCEHGVFIVNTNDVLFSELIVRFKSLRAGDKVRVLYREIYEILSTEHDRDGVREFFVSLVGYDFIDANKRFAIEKD